MKSSRSVRVLAAGAGTLLLIAGVATVLGTGATGCGSNSSPQSGCANTDTSATPLSLPNSLSLSSVAGVNVVPVTVNGSQCSSTSPNYSNKPCVSVTICTPGTSNCQTINDILVDTGSFGLRVFKSLVTESLPAVSLGGGNNLAECVYYGDGSADWGTVNMANVILGGEPAVTVPVQIIDSTYANGSTVCGGADSTPSQTGFNGILGVGPFAQDCGTDCTSAGSNLDTYFSCDGTSCGGSSATLAQQVTNPISALPLDNNGFVFELPSVPVAGAGAANGYLVLGIGTRTNNQPSGVTTYKADLSGNFVTHFNGQNYPSFLDSGSNGLFFPADSSIQTCDSVDPSYSGWLCPCSTQTLDSTGISATGSPSVDLPFLVGNRINLANSGNAVFSDIAGATQNYFDWGLPFYLGRNVYEGLEGTTSTLGTGPYWAF